MTTGRINQVLSSNREKTSTHTYSQKRIYAHTPPTQSKDTLFFSLRATKRLHPPYPVAWWHNINPSVVKRFARHLLFLYN